MSLELFYVCRFLTLRIVLVIKALDLSFTIIGRT